MTGTGGGLRIARGRLLFMGLAVLDQITEDCHRAPCRHSLALRAVLAMLYAHSDGTRAPYDQFWRRSAIPDEARDPHGSAIRRGQAVQEAFHGICRTLNVPETGAFRADLKAARTDPGNDLRCYTAPQGRMSEEDFARMRLAEVERANARARNADLARKRRGKECPLRG
jgi:hypothetical protein